MGAALKPPYFDTLSDNDGKVSKIWLNYFQSLGNQSSTGVVTLVSGTPDRITVTGTIPLPVVDIASDYAGQASIAKLGTITEAVIAESFVTNLVGDLADRIVKDPATTSRNMIEPTAGSAAALTLQASLSQIEQLLRVLSNSGALTAAISKAGLVQANQGVVTAFSISEDMDIPGGFYSQMISPIVETGVAVTVEAGGLWFIDA